MGCGIAEIRWDDLSAGAGLHLGVWEVPHCALTLIAQLRPPHPGRAPAGFALASRLRLANQLLSSFPTRTFLSSPTTCSLGGHGLRKSCCPATQWSGPGLGSADGGAKLPWEISERWTKIP